MSEKKEREIIYIKRTFDGVEYDVPFIKGNPGKTREEMDAMRAAGIPTGMGFCYCGKLNPRTYEAGPGVKCMQDQSIYMRDGTRIYADVYLPSDSTEKVPAILCWGPFGKRPAEGMDDWKLMGVPPKTVSEMAKFEAADPGYWCRNGYAIVNADPTGIGNSEGNVNLWGTDDAKNGYDTVEWIAKQEWCNGKVTLFGNSGVCMSHWKIAAEQPPHLACIAAWEGIGDLYRESFFCGGVPNPDYESGIINTCANKTYMENTIEMIHKYPLMNEYWEDKIVKWEKIRIPAYVTCGWVHHHLRGSVEGFRRIRSPKKWLRAHREFEWPDSYNPENLEDLKRFYDRYCKDINNGWEFTPKVRLQVMDAYDYDYTGYGYRRENEFPLKRTEYRKIYLDASTMGASYEPIEKEAEVCYDPKTETTEFKFLVPEETEVTGFMKLHLNIECRGHDNMDLFPWVLKYGEDGKYVPLRCMGAEYRGAWGFARGSHRELDPKYSSDFQPVAAHRKNEPMEQGKVYPIDIEMYPHSRVWHKGEYIVVRLAGKFIKTEWFHDNNMNHQVDNGDGIHVIHTGGQYDSYLQIPVIPPKWKTSTYTYNY